MAHQLVRGPPRLWISFSGIFSDRRIVDPDGARTSPFRCKKAAAVFSVAAKYVSTQKTWLTVLDSVALGCHSSLLIERIKCWGQVITEEGKSGRVDSQEDAQVISEQISNSLCCRMSMLTISTCWLCRWSCSLLHKC